MIAGHDAHTGLPHQGLGAILQPHGTDRRWRRADKCNPRLGAGFRESGVLGQKAVTGMDALRARLQRGFNDALDDEITFRGGGRPDQVRLVALPDVQRIRASACE